MYNELGTEISVPRKSKGNRIITYIAIASLFVLAACGGLEDDSVDNNNGSTGGTPDTFLPEPSMFRPVSFLDGMNNELSNNLGIDHNKFLDTFENSGVDYSLFYTGTFLTGTEQVEYDFDIQGNSVSVRNTADLNLRGDNLGPQHITHEGAGGYYEELLPGTIIQFVDENKTVEDKNITPETLVYMGISEGTDGLSYPIFLFFGGDDDFDLNSVVSLFETSVVDVQQTPVDDVVEETPVGGEPPEDLDGLAITLITNDTPLYPVRNSDSTISWELIQFASSEIHLRDINLITPFLEQDYNQDDFQGFPVDFSRLEFGDTFLITPPYDQQGDHSLTIDGIEIGVVQINKQVYVGTNQTGYVPLRLGVRFGVEGKGNIAFQGFQGSDSGDYLVWNLDYEYSPFSDEDSDQPEAVSPTQRVGFFATNTPMPIFEPTSTFQMRIISSELTDPVQAHRINDMPTTIISNVTESFTEVPNGDFLSTIKVDLDEYSSWVLTSGQYDLWSNNPAYSFDFTQVGYDFNELSLIPGNLINISSGPTYYFGTEDIGFVPANAGATINISNTTSIVFMGFLNNPDAEGYSVPQFLILESN